MTSVRAPLPAFRDGTLPNVCAVSGAIARDNYQLMATSPSGPVPGAVPLTEATVQSLRSLQRLTLGLFVVSVTLMAVSLAARAAVLGLISFALLAAAIGCLVTGNKRNVKIRVDGDHVLFDHVHPNFAKAIERPGGKCAGCPSVDDCSTEAVEQCEGHQD